MNLNTTNQKQFTLNLNWPKILAFIVFWSYGLYGTVQPQSLMLRVLIFAAVLVIFLFFLILGNKPNKFTTTLTITRHDVIIIGSYILILAAVSFGFLNNSLVQDELYHAQYSQLHSIFFIDHFSHFLPAIANWPYWLVLYVVNLATLAGALVFLFLMRKTSVAVKVVIYGGLFVLLRFAITYLGGITDPHPPLRLLPLWLVASVFSSSSFVFHLAGILALCVGLWFLYKFILPKFGSRFSWLVVLFFGSIPLFLYVGNIVEQSLWTTIIWTGLIFYTSRPGSFEKDEDYFLWFAILAAATMLRQSAFVGFVPVGLLYLRYVWQRRENFSLKNIFITLSPGLVMLPFLIKSLVVGTPASYIPGEVTFVPPAASALSRVIIALNSGIAWRAAFNSLGYYIFFLPFAFVAATKEGLKRRAVLLIFFLAAFVVFYTIRPVLWGMGRYQAEFILPFVIFGLYELTSFFTTTKVELKKPLMLVLAVLIVINIINFIHVPASNPPVDAMDLNNLQYTKVESEFVYNYAAGLNAAKAAGFAKNTYLLGVSYGVFSQILDGYTISQVGAEKILSENLKKSYSAANINAEPNVKLVLIGDISPVLKSQIISQLENFGFRPWQNFNNPRYGSTVVGLIK